jgi:hypothetical protein
VSVHIFTLSSWTNSLHLIYVNQSRALVYPTVHLLIFNPEYSCISRCIYWFLPPVYPAVNLLIFSTQACPTVHLLIFSLPVKPNLYFILIDAIIYLRHNMHFYSDIRLFYLTLKLWPTTTNHIVREWLLFNANSTIFSAVSWGEQINFQWHDDEVRIVLDQHDWLDFIVLAHWNNSPLGSTIQIPGQPVFALSP